MPSMCSSCFLVCGDLVLCNFRSTAMSEVSETTSSRVGSNAHGVGQVETYSAPITTMKLDGSNFLPRLQSAKLIIMGRGK